MKWSIVATKFHSSCHLEWFIYGNFGKLYFGLVFLVRRDMTWCNYELGKERQSLQQTDFKIQIVSKTSYFSTQSRVVNDIKKA